jgi:AcrR family transcriptional regulator
MKKQTRRYSSPVREAQVRETRERLMRAVARWMARRPHDELNLAGIARWARVERRTLFRHFATKEELLAAFWDWANHRVTPAGMPDTLAEVLAAPVTLYAGFEAEAGLIQASLHSRAGREMRLANVARRQAAVRAASAELGAEVSAADRRRFEALAHVLCSAAAWETMRDYAGLNGREAGAAAAWALRLAAEAVRSGRRISS